MRFRTFGRLGWQVSEVGYGMWGMSSWSNSDDDASRAALEESVRLGCNFFDTAWGYGRGHSERLLGELVRSHPETRLYTASKIPPRNMQWPSRRGTPLDETFPPEHIREFAERSLENIGGATVDLFTDDPVVHAHGARLPKRCFKSNGSDVTRKAIELAYTPPAQTLVQFPLAMLSAVFTWPVPVQQGQSS